MNRSLFRLAFALDRHSKPIEGWAAFFGMLSLFLARFGIHPAALVVLSCVLIGLALVLLAGSDLLLDYALRSAKLASVETPSEA